MCERRVRRRVGDVVGRHVDRLQRRVDTPAEVIRSCRSPISPARLAGTTALGMRPSRVETSEPACEPEDVVHEQQHVEVLLVAEVLSHRERRQRHTQPHARGLVHLAEDERGLLDHARFGHLDEEVVALAGPLSHTREDRDAAVLFGLAADHLLDDHGLADASTAEHADLATLHGSSRSITLMPVSSITFFGSRSANGGASRWIGQ